VLFVSAGLAPDGGGIAAAGRLLLAATRQWAAARGARVRLLTLGAADELPEGLEGRAFHGSRARLAVAVWRAQLAGFRVHVYDFLGAARIQGLLPPPLRASYLLYLYGIECWRPLRGIRRRALTGATVRLCCSGHTLAELRRSNPGLPEAAVVPLALPPPAPAGALDEAMVARAGEGFLLIVGRMAPGERYKGHEALLGALSRLAADHPGIRLVVTGGGEDRPRLEAVAAGLGVGERVLFTGFVSAATLDRLYARCVAFVMPSAGEGFGLVYLEAMRAGKPCVALAGGAAAEIVLDGVTGSLVEPGVEPLTAALAELLAEPRRARAMGSAGRARWEREFGAEAFAARLRPHLDTVADVAGMSGRARTR
jgi:phosphatidylinositol alpha-1,6-mannosyltransferase